MINPDDYIFVGKIGRTIGRDGSLTIVSYTSFPQRFKKMKTFFLTKEKKTPFELIAGKVEVTESRITVSFKDFDTEEKAKTLIGYRITVHKKDRVIPPKGTYFIEDLLSCEVFDLKGELIGKMKDVMEQSSNDIYVVDHKGLEVLIPAVSQFIKDIDIENKRIKVSLIDGMLPDED
ncbi:MAG TPA: ribosome maturation factor RimM [Clostridiales bacterium]|jgi:16S rRNA processing protein RimM|nr:ribosome maturation factor RimM [Clostridiales bacterium]HQP70064.1 ribosome maturation factor RimM [Clostridiales bacterium]